MIDRSGGRARIAVILLLIGGLIAGCVTTKDRYENAQDLAAEGRHVESVRSYVRVLEADSDWTEAREELEAVGPRAVDDLLAEADSQAADGRYEDAVATLRTLDDLRADTEAVGVTLEVPDDYAEYRADLIRMAADALVEEGAAAEDAGDWADAAEAYERARDYVADAERLTRLEEAEARVWLRWSEEELAADRYRTAYERAAEIADLLPPEHPIREEAAALQTTAIDEGSRVVAFLPLWRTGEAGSAMPNFFMRDLNDVLKLDHWTRAPEFIAPVDPIATRRMLREVEAVRAILPRSVAAEVGRELGADLVLAGEVVGFERVVTPISEQTRDTRMRVRGATGQGMVWRDTTYVEQTVRLEVEATVEWRLIDARSRRTVDRGTEREAARGDVQRGVFAGDYRQLDLSGRELSLFNPNDLRDEERAVEDQLIEVLAAGLADEVFARILHRID